MLVACEESLSEANTKFTRCIKSSLEYLFNNHKKEVMTTTITVNGGFLVINLLSLMNFLIKFATKYRRISYLFKILYSLINFFPICHMFVGCEKSLKQKLKVLHIWKCVGVSHLFAPKTKDLKCKPVKRQNNNNINKKTIFKTNFLLLFNSETVITKQIFSWKIISLKSFKTYK